MSVIIKSDKKATANLGNINGIKGSQDWSIFLDFENQVYSTKKNNVAKKDYKLEDVVEATRTNLNGAPISIAKDGTVKAITSTADIRTALLKNGRFGLLAEDTSENFFLNSGAPVSQIINLAAASTKIIVSCEGSGSLTVTGDVVGSGRIVTENSPYVFDRTSSTIGCNLSITVNGSVSHTQVELATGDHTASTPIKTTSTAVVRPRETVKLKQSLFDEMILHKSAFTLLVQTIPLNMALNASNALVNQLALDSGNQKLLVMSGISNGNLMGYVRSYVGSASTNNTAVASGTFDAVNRFKPHNTAMAIGTGKVSAAYRGMQEPDLAITETNILEVLLGTGYSSPVGQNGLRGIITKLVVYDRILSKSELVDLSKSWLD